MIWSTVMDNTYVKVEVNFNAGVYKQERSIVRVLSKNNTVVFLFINGSKLAEYEPDESRMVYIDLTDYFSTIAVGVERTQDVAIATPISSLVYIGYNIQGLRSPYELLIPYHEEFEDVILITPPTRWLAPLWGLADKVEIFSRSIGADSYIEYTSNYIDYEQTSNDRVGSYNIGTGFGVRLELWENANRIIERKSYYRSSLVCNRNYAAVEWQSRTGATKRNTWEVRDVKEVEYDTVELQSRYNAYKESKGSEVTFVLRLDELTRYDYWYYSDIITSNDVRVALSEDDADFGEWTRVQVLTKSAEQPNANGLYVLEIEVKYRRYDRI